MNEFDECGVFGYCVILEFHFNFFVVGVGVPRGFRPPTAGTTFWWGGGSAPLRRDF